MAFTAGPGFAPKLSAKGLQPRGGWVIASKAICVLTVLDPVDAQRLPSRSADRPPNQPAATIASR